MTFSPFSQNWRKSSVGSPRQTVLSSTGVVCYIALSSDKGASWLVKACQFVQEADWSLDLNLTKGDSKQTSSLF